jgi:serine/threonine protein kinase
MLIGNPKLQVSQQEWNIAMQFFSDRRNNGVNKLSRKDAGTTHSFIKVNGTIYAMAEKDNILGEGSSGIVKIAQDIHGRNYAVKVEWKLDPTQVSRQEELYAMQQQALLIGVMEREYMGAKPIPAHVPPGTKTKIYTLQILAEGEDLDTFLQKNPRLPIDARYKIALNIALAVRSLKEKGIVHSDLKPANIIINPNNGKVTIIDFGAARILQHENAAAPSIAYTPGYAPATVIAGQRVAFKTDVFALGKIFVDLGLGHRTITGRMQDPIGQNRPKINEVISTLQSWLAPLPQRPMPQRPAPQPQPMPQRPAPQPQPMPRPIQGIAWRQPALQPQQPRRRPIPRGAAPLGQNEARDRAAAILLMEADNKADSPLDQQMVSDFQFALYIQNQEQGQQQYPRQMEADFQLALRIQNEEQGNQHYPRQNRRRPG